MKKKFLVCALSVFAVFSVASSALAASSYSPSPVTTDSISPQARQTLTLRVGEYYAFNNSIVTVVYNADNIIHVKSPVVTGMKPGQAVINVSYNGVSTQYDVFVKSNI
ncbi:hypothetical protein [Paenibacillus tengchongensis]|uniref:hypothetical protein n=1 Tax=Paenibacillus tengchongensis TaxID=2608684 RepID=UPI00124CF588|nr:hypothetical protein [Paenibacillus tengchongensis]